MKEIERLIAIVSAIVTVSYTLASLVGQLSSNWAPIELDANTVVEPGRLSTATLYSFCLACSFGVFFSMLLHLIIEHLGRFAILVAGTPIAVASGMQSAFVPLYYLKGNMSSEAHIVWVWLAIVSSALLIETMLILLFQERSHSDEYVWGCSPAERRRKSDFGDKSLRLRPKVTGIAKWNAGGFGTGVLLISVDDGVSKMAQVDGSLWIAAVAVATLVACFAGIRIFERLEG